jgi:hypothetical protein
MAGSLVAGVRGAAELEAALARALSAEWDRLEELRQAAGAA